MAPIEDRSIRDTWLGVGLTVLLHLIQLPIAMVTFGVALMLIGVSQLLYIIPAIIIAKRRGRPGIARGLMIGASVTFLLNTACFGFALFVTFGLNRPR